MVRTSEGSIRRRGNLAMWSGRTSRPRVNQIAALAFSTLVVACGSLGRASASARATLNDLSTASGSSLAIARRAGVAQLAWPCASRKPASPPGDGGVVGPDALDEGAERAILCGAASGVAIYPYRDIHAERSAVLLVHGLNGSPSDLADIAERLRSAGRQIFIAYYDDRSIATHESGRRLAEALRTLRRQYPGVEHLDIVAHSMGGIVARAALNYLQEPGWLGGDTGTASLPRAGFSSVRLRCVDTPWDGYDHEPQWASGLVTPGLRAAMTFAGWLGAFDMRANSRMFARLFAPDLEGVEIQNWAAVQGDEPDHVRSVPELSVREREALGRFLLDGQLPEEHRLRNMANSLRQGGRFDSLQARVRRASDESDDEEGKRSDRWHLASVVTDAYEQTMPREPGSHTGILRDHPSLRDDLVDRLVRELGSHHYSE